MKLILWRLISLLIWIIPSPSLAQTPTAWELLGVLNEVRIANGLTPLAMNSQLMTAAQRHSNDMATQDALFHQGSDGTWFWDRVNATGYALVDGAENVLYRFDTSGVGAFIQWQGSADHNANMMSPLYVEVGIAYAFNATSGRYYFTMVLANRADFLPPTPTAPPLPTITPIPTITAIPTIASSNT
ncbi:MAG: CAP domain-containing protein, partial [Anaerolineae bacterium]|nr:CAP domain-containing protein [Anaerolineae bacterium]